MVIEEQANARRVMAISSGIGVVACALLLWLLYGRGEVGAESSEFLWLPAWNAACNAASACCLLAGFRAIRARAVSTHMRWMLAALAFSALFLVGYVTHHALHGDTRFLGTGVVRTLYFSVLASHVVLSAAALPLILATVWFAATARWATHRRVARFTLPLWLYVSVTGVLVYVFLRAYA
jgi:putative membrane protein